MLLLLWTNECERFEFFLYFGMFIFGIWNFWVHSLSIWKQIKYRTVTRSLGITTELLIHFKFIKLFMSLFTFDLILYLSELYISVSILRRQLNDFFYGFLSVANDEWKEKRCDHLGMVYYHCAPTIYVPIIFGGFINTNLFGSRIFLRVFFIDVVRVLEFGFNLI